VREEPVSLQRLLAADEVFLTGSVRGIESVRALEGTEWVEATITPLVSDELRLAWESDT
jgi:branched-subunit amino acid aminotransferase/4-amino-4-deoxychorismate lyase